MCLSWARSEIPMALALENNSIKIGFSILKEGPLHLWRDGISSSSSSAALETSQDMKREKRKTQLAEELSEADEEEEKGEEEEERCVLITECMLCSKLGNKVGMKECKDTNRVQLYECSIPSKPEYTKRRKEYRSCKRTVADEEWLVFRMQLFCLLLGLISTYAARMQKRAHATLFDQRKMKKNRQNLSFRIQPAMLGGNEEELNNGNHALRVVNREIEELDPLIATSKSADL